MGMRALLPLLCLLLLAACGDEASSSPPPEIKQDASNFFDLEAYIDREVARLQNEKGRTFQKSIAINGQRETQEIDHIDFEKDLAIFRKAAINRPAWRDKYEVERTTYSERYTALDSSLLTQQLEVVKDTQGQVSRVRIVGRSGSVLSQEQKQLLYEPGKGYRINSQRGSQLLGDTDVEIVVSFVRGK